MAVMHPEVHEGVWEDVNLVMQTDSHPHVQVVQGAHEWVQAERVVHRTADQHRWMAEAVAIEKEVPEPFVPGTVGLLEDGAIEVRRFREVPP
jgi:hypothetical protein